MTANCLAVCSGCYPLTKRSGEDYGMPVNNAHLKQWPFRDHQDCNGVLTTVFCFLTQVLTLRRVSWHKNSTRWHQKYRSFILPLVVITVQGEKKSLLVSQTVIFLVFIQGESEKWGTRYFLWNVSPLERLFPWSHWMWSSGNHNYRYLLSTWCFVVAT